METIAPASTRTIRAARSLFVIIAVIGAVLTAATLIRGQGTASTVVLFAIGALPAAYIQLFLANSRLLVGTDQFGYRDAFGRPHLWYASQVGRIVDVAVTDVRDSSSRRVIYFLGLDGRRLFLINPAPWPEGTMDRLAAIAGKPLEVRPSPYTAADFKREFPLAVSWPGRHGGLLVAGAIVIAAAIALATIFLR